jgi:diadenosine tetraphosphate (Ap4A) HIT family hydrolase
MTRTCELCDEIAGLSSRFDQVYGNILRDRIVFCTRNFVVMPSIGQLGDGHLMIVSRLHVTAASHLDTRMRKELTTLIRYIRDWMSVSVGSNVVVFENGDPKGNGQMGCTIGHLHVHLVASRQPTPTLLVALYSLGAKASPGLPELQEVSDAYSWIEMGRGNALVIPHRLPSQTLRRLIAGELGIDRWDWQDAGREQQLIELVRAARAGLAEFREAAAA